MGRKKKDQNEKEEQDKEIKKRLKFNLASEAKRSVAAIFLVALAVLVTLGFWGRAGIVGENVNKLVSLAIGWTKFVLPLFLAMAGIVLLFRKETSFYVVKIAGLLVTFFSLTSFFHWFYNADEMLKVAQGGQGGGYFGFMTAYFLNRYLGSAGSLVVILALFSIGAIIAFNFSLIKFLGWFKKEKEETADSESSLEEDKPIVEDKEKEASSEETSEEESDSENNIGRVEFAEGSDQYVSPSLSEASAAEPDFSRKKLVMRKSLDISRPEKNYALEKNSRKQKWVFPPADLLDKSSGTAKGGDTEKNAEIIEKTLKDFGIEVGRGEIKTGPSVTQYSFRPAVGVKVAKIMSLQNDLSLALAAHPIRIEAPIPGKSLLGIEVPNKVSALVRLREIMENQDFRVRKSNLTLALGKDVSGNFIFSNLEKMPHLMIAGATGTGKSVCLNSIITTLLYQNSSEDLKFIMIDPKRVELSLYNGIPHLLSGVVVENSKAINALKWTVGEMERRYKLFQDTASRDIDSYKEKLRAGKKRRCANAETGEISEEEMENLPYIVIVIDELADLMGSHGKEVEGAIVRIAQMARAVGIHLIISTQRPSVEVITGLIKANITTRIAFQVATQIDSRTILDMGGAEKLLGNGDMLYLSVASPKPKRIQGIFISELEVKKVVRFIKSQKVESGSDIGNSLESGPENYNATGKNALEIFDFKNSGENSSGNDDLYEAAKTEVTRAKKASASLLQRRLRVGYARAARLLDMLEEKGVVGPSDGAKPREVYGSEKAEEAEYKDEIKDQEKRDKWQI